MDFFDQLCQNIVESPKFKDMLESQGLDKLSKMVAFLIL